MSDPETSSEISVLGRKWRKKEHNEELANEVRRTLNLSDLASLLISTRVGDIFAAEKFISPKIRSYLPDPFHLKDMEKAVDSLISAIENNQKICIFADYDVDGATSSACIKNVLRDIGVNAEIYVPDRIEEGYGPTEIAMERIAKMGTDLLITVDCGSVAFDALAHASKLGMKTVVIDHHISMDQIPEAEAVVNPNRLDETSEYTNLAAAGVSFLYMVALTSKLKKQGYFEKNDINEPNLLNQLDIVALGTVCDVMQLSGLNRAFVATGLKVAKQRGNVGYRALCDAAGLEEAISCYHLGFVLGPRINAGGRVGKSSLGANLLSTTSMSEAEAMAAELDMHNADRKAIEAGMLDEAMHMAKEQEDNALIFVVGEGWHPGVIGIVAGRLKEKYNRPVAVVSLIDGVGKASCRSVKGADFGTALLEAKNQGLLVAGGGHALAAGFTAEGSKLQELQEFLQNRFEKDLAATEEHLYEHYDAILTTKAANLNLMRELEILEPFGTGNRAPVFKFEKMFVLQADIVGQKHIRVSFAPSYDAHGSVQLNAIAFNAAGTELGDVLMSRKAKDLSVFGTLKINKWQDRENIQLQLKDVVVL